MTRFFAGAVVVGFLSLTGHVKAEGSNSVGHKPDSPNKKRAQALAGDPDARLLEKLDIDSDGVVSHAELLRGATRHIHSKVTARFRQLDRNLDGRVTPSEVIGMSSARFARFDLNADGAFTAFELQEAMRSQLVKRVRQVFASLDLNNDGRCSRSEFQDHRLALRMRKARRTKVARATQPIRRF